MKSDKVGKTCTLGKLQTSAEKLKDLNKWRNEQQS